MIAVVIMFFRLFFSAEWQTLLDVRSFTGKRKDEFTLISRQVCHSAFFLAIRRLRYVTPQMFVLSLANCFALQRLAVFLPDVLLSRHGASDFHGFAACTPYSDISASH
ncbi:MAG: hypothetical protein AUI01_05400 [Ktedonobacter sp. 13_2_20CM_2_56_8]|nr:MAG: hypothetical protein AUI01_05400 [Ktedonobacter sp. 13_2_20CM_2_56_8]